MMPIDKHNTDANEISEKPHLQEDPISQNTIETRDRVQSGIGGERMEKQRCLGKDFFAMQIAFAKCAAKLKNIPLNDALYRYTCLYRRFGIPNRLEPDHPLWRQFLSDLDSAQQPEDVAYAYALEHVAPKESSGKCFHYEYDSGEKRVHMHFENNDQDEHGPLSDARLPVRLAELATMFKEIKSNHPEALAVSGSSWIYNVPNYRRLFPPEYTKEPMRAPNGYTGMSVWGQFIDRKGQLKTKEASEFLERLSGVQSEDEIPDAFPMKQLAVKGDIQEFYRFYNII